MTDLAFKTIPNVPIVSTGTYRLAGNPYPGGETTFTADDLADAVAAMDDPAVQLPRIKLGHESDWGDAEPAFGKVDNLRLGDDGQTVYGDLVGVPTWLAEILPIAYPNRSIEAGMNVTTATGRKYRMVIGNLALLGVVLPGVSTLSDLAGLYSEEVVDDIEVEAAQEVTAEVEESMRIFKRSTRGSINLEDVRRAYYDSLDGPQAMWWIRAVYLDPNELIVDDDDGGLFRIPFETNGEAVEFGEPIAVKVQYVNAGGGGADAMLEMTAAETVFASRAESREETNTPTKEVSMDKVRERLGLPADATEDDILAALDDGEGNGETPDPASDAAPTSTEAPAGDDGDEDDDDDDEDSDETGSDDAAASKGDTITVDAATLSEMQRNAQLGAQVHAERQRELKDQTISGAIKAGKIPPARREHYERAWDADPEGTRQLLDEMPDDLVPVQARGGSPAESVSQDSYPEDWLPEVKARKQGRVVKETV